MCLFDLIYVYSLVCDLRWLCVDFMKGMVDVLLFNVFDVLFGIVVICV